MNKPIIIAMPGDESPAAGIARRLGAKTAALEYRRFPDGESYLRIDDPLEGASVVLVARLDRPDAKIPSLLFAADLVRELGAVGVGLVAPYLPYMRQDIRFRSGEALTSASFARWISIHFDWLITVDPHLHRYASLDEIYTIPAVVVPAAPALADWIGANVEQPVVIGPDAESGQWVEAVAVAGDLRWRVMGKQRLGDHEVRVIAPDLRGLEHRTPVLVDDIASSGATLARAAEALKLAGLSRPVCVVVHGLFGEGARSTLGEAGIQRLVCTDSVRTDSAEPPAIALAPLLAPAIEDMLQGAAEGSVHQQQ